MLIKSGGLSVQDTTSLFENKKSPWFFAKSFLEVVIYVNLLLVFHFSTDYFGRNLVSMMSGFFAE